MSILNVFQKEEKAEEPKTATPKERRIAKDNAPRAGSNAPVSVLKKPHVSEKAYRLNASNANQYVFLVDVTATKPAVRSAIEKRYQVHVERVTTLRRAGKLKHVGSRFAGRGPKQKKAVVMLRKGEKIDLA